LKGHAPVAKTKGEHGPVLTWSLTRNGKNVMSGQVLDVFDLSAGLILEVEGDLDHLFTTPAKEESE